MLSNNRFSQGHLTWPGFLYLLCAHGGLEYYVEVSRSVYLLEVYPNETRQDMVGFPTYGPFYSLLKKVGLSF